MNLTTILGILAGMGCVIYGILADAEVAWFISPSSMFITLGGTLAATVASNTVQKLINAGKAFKKVIINKSPKPMEAIEMIVDMANVARREGLLRLEEQVDEIDDLFLQKGIRLIVDGIEPAEVSAILESEIDSMEDRHAQVWSVFDGAAAMAPAFGMIGTLIGLIAMLKQLSDPDALGPGMSMALVTTFYGTLIANVIFTPISKSLKSLSAREVLHRQIMMEGLLSIQAGVVPYVIKEKLLAYLPLGADMEEEKKAKKAKPKAKDEGESSEAA